MICKMCADDALEKALAERDEAQRAALELAERLEPSPAELAEMVRRWPWLLRFADGDPPNS
jgi:DnaJ-domain-containing protein 1